MNRHRPGRVTRMLLRAPGRLYDWRCGWLLGHRFLRLTHIGRNSGRHYQTMLEVIRIEPALNESDGRPVSIVDMWAQISVRLLLT